MTQQNFAQKMFQRAGQLLCIEQRWYDAKGGVPYAKVKVRIRMVTLILFLISITGQWMFGGFAFKNEQFQHGQLPQFSEFFVNLSRDTLENWQSEFLQLIWQVAGLAYLWYVGSPQSKEGDDRKEEKLDAILRRLDSEHADRVIAELDAKYPRK